MFIDGECEDLKVVVGGGEFARSIGKRKKSDVLQAYGYSICDKCYRQDCFFKKHVEYRESGR